MSIIFFQFDRQKLGLDHCDPEEEARFRRSYGIPYTKTNCELVKYKSGLGRMANCSFLPYWGIHSTVGGDAERPPCRPYQTLQLKADWLESAPRIVAREGEDPATVIPASRADLDWACKFECLMDQYLTRASYASLDEESMRESSDDDFTMKKE